ERQSHNDRQERDDDAVQHRRDDAARLEEELHGRDRDGTRKERLRVVGDVRLRRERRYRDQVERDQDPDREYDGTSVDKRPVEHPRVHRWTSASRGPSRRRYTTIAAMLRPRMTTPYVAARCSPWFVAYQLYASPASTGRLRPASANTTAIVWNAKIG